MNYTSHKKASKMILTISALYRFPALLMFLLILSFTIVNYNSFYYILTNTWPILLISAILIIIGEGLSNKNYYAWWSAIASIIFIFYLLTKSIINYIPDLEQGCITGAFAGLSIFILGAIILFYFIILTLLLIPSVKKVFIERRNISDNKENNMQQISSLSKHLSVLQNSINTGIIVNGKRILLIDCGVGISDKFDNNVIDTVLLTHYHRDGFSDLLRITGAEILVPQEEKNLFEKAEDFWGDLKYRWHLYNYRPGHLVPAENIPVSRGLVDGEVIKWGVSKITAIATPGHTDGSMSYIVVADGVRTAFIGDLMYDAGKIWELLSLQHGDDNLWDYHAFLGKRKVLIASLRRVLEYAPDVLVPTHGKIITDPKAAVDLLAERLDAAWENYISVNTIRSYFPDKFENKPEYLPIREALPVPAYLRHIDTSWIIISNSGAAFVMDCGTPRVISELQRMMGNGEITGVEGLWITHMHDDHVETISDFQNIFNCPLYADPAVADVIADPRAWRLPCISPGIARVDRRTCEGEKWQWHEFTLTAYNFPGQTLYHDGLMVESENEPRIFFVGDSFALAGMDDYCAHNRNFLGKDVGFDRCITLLQTLKPDLLFNPHVDGGFNFTDEEYQRMRGNLSDRETLYADLFPWPHPNFATDDFWGRCHPYEQDAAPGATVCLNLIITNHADSAINFTAQAKQRADWPQNSPNSADIPAKSEIAIPLSIILPHDLTPGRYAVTIDITMGERILPEFTETIIVIG